MREFVEAVGRGAEPAVLPVRDAVRRRRDRPPRHPHRPGHLPVRDREHGRTPAPTGSASSGCDGRMIHDGSWSPTGARSRAGSSATCRQLGIETVAVHSDADAGLPFVAEADVAVRLPGERSRRHLPRVDLSLDAAKRAGADAIHPGYGFLSENADFARAVDRRPACTWVGPTPESIEQMGSKVEAKELMEAAGVPVLPQPRAGRATEDDLPLLVKASAGGGGRGMRVVRDLGGPGRGRRGRAGRGGVRLRRRHGVRASRTSSAAATSRCRSSATARRRARARRARLLGPAAAPEGRRGGAGARTSPARCASAMHDAARAAAAAIGYVGAGTVEFLYDPSDRAVLLPGDEHPAAGRAPGHRVVHGVDLVALQLAVAEGRVVCPSSPRALGTDPPAGTRSRSGCTPRTPPPTSSRRAAVAHHLRDPPRRRPDPGRLRLRRRAARCRTHYDAMLAKVIAHAPTRARGRPRRWPRALARARIHGVTTNRDLLVAILRDAGSSPARCSTGFLDGRTRETAVGPGSRPLRGGRGCRGRATNGSARGVQRGHPAGVAQRGLPAAADRRFEVAGEQQSVAWLGGRDGVVFAGLRHPGPRRRAGPGHPRGRRHPLVDRRTIDRSASRARGSPRRRAPWVRSATRGAAVRRPGRRGRQRHLCSRRCPAPWSASRSPRATGSRPARPSWSSRR